MSTKFSVLLSVYINDNSSHFDLALESIFNSSIRPNEVLIVEDGPLSKDLHAVIKKYSNSYPELVKTIRNKKNIGLGRSLAKGINECSFELVARMDADDICHTDRFKKQLGVYSERKDLSIVGSNIDEYDGEMVTLLDTRYVPESNSEIIAYAKKRNPFNHMSVMFKKGDVLAAGGYQHMAYFEDYYLWCRMLSLGFKGYNIQESLVDVRSGNAMYRRRGGLSYARDIINFQNAIHKLGFIGNCQKLSNITIRASVAVSPLWLKGNLYKKHLRKKVK